MKVMNHCLFVDIPRGVARGKILGRAMRAGGRPAPGAGDETIRIDFEVLHSRSDLLAICSGAVRAASLLDAELDWLVGGPLRPGQLMWTLTETPTGDPHAIAN